MSFWSGNHVGYFVSAKTTHPAFLEHDSCLHSDITPQRFLTLSIPDTFLSLGSPVSYSIASVSKPRRRDTERR